MTYDAGQRNPSRYIGQGYQFTASYVHPRDPTANDLRDPANQGYYPVSSTWVNKTTKKLWVLVSVANKIATWIPLSGSGTPPVISVTGDGGTAVPTAAGDIELIGETIANATHTKPVYTALNSSSQLNVQVQVAAAVAATPADKSKAGLAQFNSAHFSVNADGFVSLSGGGSAVDQFQVQAATAPGVNPVDPDNTGLVTFNGAAVANHNVPIETRTRALNAMNVEVQLATSNSTTDATKIGLAAFDSAAFAVDSNAWVQTKTGIQPGVSNIAFTYSAGTFTVAGADGTSLATKNGYVTLLNNGALCNLITIPVTANQTFLDIVGGADLTGNNFGTTAGAAWANAMPFYLYAIVKNDNSAINFAISRVPHLTSSPAAGNLSKAGSTTASTQGSMFLLSSPASLADWASRPVLCVGSFRMTKDSSNQWTVSALSQTDGIGQFQENIQFDYPVGQNGASATSHFVEAATFPAFSDKFANYNIKRGGQFSYSLLYGDLTSDGVNAANIVATVPMIPLNGENKPAGWYALTTNQLFASNLAGGASTTTFRTSGATGTMVNSDFTGSPLVNAQFVFKMDYLLTTA